MTEATQKIVSTVGLWLDGGALPEILEDDVVDFDILDEDNSEDPQKDDDLKKARIRQQGNRHQHY